MSFRPRIKSVVLLAVSLLIAAPMAASAQDRAVRVPERLRHRDRLAAVDLPANTVAAAFSVAPGVARARVRARVVRGAPAGANRELQAPTNPPAPPDPMEPETMNLVAVALGGGGGGGGAGAAADIQNPGPPVLDHIELSARRLWVNEKGYLDFILPYELNPSTPSINFNKNFPGIMTVRLKVEEGKNYLVDFSVKSWGQGTYRVETSGGEQEFDDPQGKLEHVLVALSATESGWTNVKFQRLGDSGHYLFTVHVDRIE
jgi:hypothetical protein